VGAFDVNCSICGDVNLDGELTVDNIYFLQQVYFGSLQAEFTLSEGDINCDTGTNIADIVTLAGYYYGRVPTRCCSSQPEPVYR